MIPPGERPPFGGRPVAEWSEWELRTAEERLCELAAERWRRDGSPLWRPS